MIDVTILKEQYPLQFGVDNPVLRSVCDEVETITSEIQALYTALWELVWEYDGVGLAAPQVGKTVRMAAITQRDTSKKKRKLTKEFVMINPVIIGQSEQESVWEEWCLSLPWQTGKLFRPNEITVKYMDNKGKHHVHHARGFNARVLFHEIDHLDGVLYVDKLV